VEALLDALRGQGGRITPGRRAIVEELVSAEGHLTAEELAARCEARQPDVHLATVYRTLESLEAAGAVSHVHFGHGPAVWHLGSDERHHLVCEGCGWVGHVPAELFAEVASVLADRYGFTVALRHFATPGWCPRCAPAGASGAAGQGSSAGEAGPAHPVAGIGPASPAVGVGGA
jgi:Fur family transcriptional regulator, ferric uptake regulator